MSAVVLKQCYFCGQVATKKLTRGKNNCKDICGGAVAHRECLNQYCVLCNRYAADIYKSCLSCGARIHESCHLKESRRPASRQLGHRWSSASSKAAREDPVNFAPSEELCCEWDPEKGMVTTRAAIGAFEKKK